MKQDTEFLLSGDASRILGKTPATVRMYADKGILPCVRTAGGARLYRKADVEALREKRANSNGGRS